MHSAQPCVCMMSSRRRLALSCASCVRVDLGRGARAMSRRVPTRRRARCEMHGHASSAHLRAHAASAACALRFFSVPSLVDASTLRRTRAACRPTAPVGARLTTRALRHRPWLQCLRPRQPRPLALVHLASGVRRPRHRSMIGVLDRAGDLRTRLDVIGQRWRKSILLS